MQKSRKLPSGRYQARLTLDGRRVTLGTFDKKKDADAAMAKALGESARGTFDDGVAGSITFEEFAAKVIEIRKAELAPRSLSNYKTALKLHILPSFGSMRLRDIKRIDVTRWWNAQPATPGRKNNYRVLTNVFTVAVDEEELKASPCKVKGAGMDLSEARPPLRSEMLEAILDASSPDLSAFLHVVFGGALRIGEALGLDRRHIDLKTGVIIVEQQVASEAGGATIRTQTKNGEDRKVRLATVELEAVRAYVKRHPSIGNMPLFMNERGQRWGKSSVYRQWHAATKAAGFEWAHIHDVRHAALTMFTEDGGTMAEVMAVAGHKDYRSAMRYQHSDDERMMKIIEKRSARLFNNREAV